MVVVLVAPARLAQSVEHQTLNLRVVGSSPTLGEAFMKVVKVWDQENCSRNHGNQTSETQGHREGKV